MISIAPTLLYVADPMCSWCWGFSPVIGEIAKRYGERADLEVIMGGLRPGATAPMDEADRATIREHWEHVQAASGQPFDFGFFERHDFVYDTEPACRAVVTVRSLDAESTLPFLARLHEAFYRENRDVTGTDTLADLGEELGLDRTVFLSSFKDEETDRATRSDFELTARLGVGGFPSLLGYDGEVMAVLTTGYRPLEQLLPVIEHWLDQAGTRHPRGLD